MDADAGGSAISLLNFVQAVQLMVSFACLLVHCSFTINSRIISNVGHISYQLKRSNSLLDLLNDHSYVKLNDVLVV